MKKMEEAMTGSHFCHFCLSIGNPIMEFEIVCPFCRSGFIEELEYSNTARDYDDNDNSYYNGKLRAICLDGQLVIFLYWNRRCFTKEDAFLDLVLPGHKHGHDSVCTAEHQESKQAEADPSTLCPELMVVPDLSSTDQTSPCSPSNSDSSISSFALDHEDPDFQMLP